MPARSYSDATLFPSSRDTAPLPFLKSIVEKTWLAAFIVLALAFVAYLFRNDKDKILEILRADLRLLGHATIAPLLTTLVPLDEAILLMLLFRIWAVCSELLASFAVIALRFFRSGAASSPGD